MSEEKKLDEKKLEGVTGGTVTDDAQNKAEVDFIFNNCFSGCYHENYGGCPYKTKHEAFTTEGAKCSKRETRVS